MSYIGYSQAANHIAPPHTREVLVPDGSATYFDLQNDVVGFHEANVIVVINNVIQEPNVSYTIINDANLRPRRLDFAGTALAATDSLYVIHQGTGTIYNTPAAGSVTKTSMAANMVSHVVDKFAGSEATTSGGNARSELQLSEIPTTADSISVYVSGVYQRAGAGNNYNVASGTNNLIFSSSLATTDQIDVHHHTFRSATTKVADLSVGAAQLSSDAITTAKIADANITTAKIADGQITAAKLAANVIPGHLSTSAAPPTSPAPTIGQAWFNINSGVTYQYVSDGTSNLWLDNSSGGIGTNAGRGVDYVGDIDPPANHNGGSATLAVGQVYYNRTRHVYYLCTNATNGSNVWRGNLPYSGGTITTYGSYRVHTFLTSGTFYVDSVTSVDYLVVGGGGSGASSHGSGSGSGGGGAGGFRFNTAPFPILPQFYTITVGEGGSGTPAPTHYNDGKRGEASSFSSITSSGGGYGAAGAQPAGVGASGGGSGYDGTGGAASPVTSPVQGYAGGSVSNNNTPHAASGGGGAGGAGQGAPAVNQGGYGGIALQNLYRTGVNQYYAGGGGASGGIATATNYGGLGGNSSTVANKGGAGDGGDTAATAGTAALANTGGGGGGGFTGGGGAGGSGIVVIRYAI